MKKAVQWNLILHSWCLSYKLFCSAFFTEGPKLARCWEPLLCFLQHPLPPGFRRRGSYPAPLHTICSGIFRDEIINSSQQREKRRGKGREGSSLFREDVKNIWRLTDVERQRVEGCFWWFMGFSFEAHKMMPRRCRELHVLTAVSVHMSRVWQ